MKALPQFSNRKWRWRKHQQVTLLNGVLRADTLALRLEIRFLRVSRGLKYARSRCYGGRIVPGLMLNPTVQ